MSAKNSEGTAELDALRQRFPKPGGPAAAYQCAVILLTNGYLLYLVVSGQSSPVAIAAFNICELVMLSVIGHLALVPVPKAQRMGDPQAVGILQRIVILALTSVWLGFVYSISLSFDSAHINQVRNAHGVFEALDDLNIVWPLLLAAVATLTATLGDLARWRAQGGMFVPQMAMSAVPKILTLVFAPIPAVLISVPFAKDHPGSQAIAWSLIYLGIKAAAELGILAWQYIGMPSAKPQGRKGAKPNG